MTLKERCIEEECKLKKLMRLRLANANFFKNMSLVKS